MSSSYHQAIVFFEKTFHGANDLEMWIGMKYSRSYGNFLSSFHVTTPSRLASADSTKHGEIQTYLVRIRFSISISLSPNSGFPAFLNPIEINNPANLILARSDPLFDINVTGVRSRA